MATSKEINRIAIDELRRSYDSVQRAVDQLRIKTITFIAATFALMTYLYSDGNLFIPIELYGKIFYFMGLGATLTSIAIFLLQLRPHLWMLTTEIKELKNIKQSTEEDYLEYVKSEYIDCYVHNARTYEIKHKYFNIGFILLVFGAFTLLTIKTFTQQTAYCYNGNVDCSKSAEIKQGVPK